MAQGLLLPLIFAATAGVGAGKGLFGKSSGSSVFKPPTTTGDRTAPGIPPSTAASTAAAIPSAMTAALKQTKRAKGAAGRQSTILTGASGLGEIGSSNVERKTILGY